MEDAESLRLAGNAAWKAASFDKALECYTQSLDGVRQLANVCFSTDLLGSAARSLSNRALCWRKLGNPRRASVDFGRAAQILKGLLQSSPIEASALGPVEGTKDQKGSGIGGGGAASGDGAKTAGSPTSSSAAAFDTLAKSSPKGPRARMFAKEAPAGQALVGAVDTKDCSSRLIKALWMRVKSLQECASLESALSGVQALLKRLPKGHALVLEGTELASTLEKAITAAEAAQAEQLRLEAMQGKLRVYAPGLASIERQSELRRMAESRGRSRSDRDGEAGAVADEGEEEDDEDGAGPPDADGAGKAGTAILLRSAELTGVVCAAMAAEARALPASMGAMVVVAGGDAAEAPSRAAQRAGVSQMLRQYWQLGPRLGQPLYLVEGGWWRAWCQWAEYGVGVAPGADAPAPGSLGAAEPLAPSPDGKVGVEEAEEEQEESRAEVDAGRGGKAPGKASVSGRGGTAGASPPGPIRNDRIAAARYRVSGWAHPDTAVAQHADVLTAGEAAGDVVEFLSLRGGLSIGGASLDAVGEEALAQAAAAAAAADSPGKQATSCEEEVDEEEVQGDGAGARGSVGEVAAGAIPSLSGVAASPVWFTAGSAGCGGDGDAVVVGEQVWEALCAWHGGGPALPRRVRDARRLASSFSGVGVAGAEGTAAAGTSASDGPVRALDSGSVSAAGPALSPPLGSLACLMLDAYPEMRAVAAEKARSQAILAASRRAELTATLGLSSADDGVLAELQAGCAPYLPGTTMPAAARRAVEGLAATPARGDGSAPHARPLAELEAALPGAPDSGAAAGGGAGRLSALEAALPASAALPLHFGALPLVERACTAFAEPAARFAQRGAVGLRNLGNTCFMNSVLQCLSACWPLASWMLRGMELHELNRGNALGSGGALARELGHLVRTLWTHEDVARVGGVSPDGLKSALGRFQTQFRGFQQHDAHELLSFLLDGLHEDCNRILDKPYLQCPEAVPGGEPELARATWRWYQARNRSAVVHCTAGLLRSQLDCPACGHSACKFEPFTSLQLPIPRGFVVRCLVTLRARPPAEPAAPVRGLAPAVYSCEAGEGLGAAQPAEPRAGTAAAGLAFGARGQAGAGLRVAASMQREVVLRGSSGLTVSDAVSLAARELVLAEPDLFGVESGGTAAASGSGGASATPPEAGAGAAAAALAQRLLAYSVSKGIVSGRREGSATLSPKPGRRTGEAAAILRVLECHGGGPSATADEPRQLQEGGLDWRGEEEQRAAAAALAASPLAGAPGPAAAAAAAAAVADAEWLAQPLCVEVRLLLPPPAWRPALGIRALAASSAPIVVSVPKTATAIGLRRRVAAVLACAFRADVVAALLGSGQREAAAACVGMTPPGCSGTSAASDADWVSPERHSALHLENTARALRLVLPGRKPTPAQSAAAAAAGNHPLDPPALPCDTSLLVDALQLVPGAGPSSGTQWASVAVAVCGLWYDALDTGAFMARATPGAMGGRNDAARMESGRLDLQACLGAFAAPERLGVGNEWFCGACRRHVRALKTMSVWAAPDVLCLQLNRFKSHGVLLKSKLRDDVTFPAASMDLSRAVSPGAIEAASEEASLATELRSPQGAAFGSVDGAEALDAAMREEAGGAAFAAAAAPGRAKQSSSNVASALSMPPERLYDLFGVVRHHGGMLGGHYTAHASRFVARYGAASPGNGSSLCGPVTEEGTLSKTDMDSLAGTSWAQFDDAVVRRVPLAEATAPGDAYMLFFRRRGLVCP